MSLLLLMGGPVGCRCDTQEHTPGQTRASKQQHTDKPARDHEPELLLRLPTPAYHTHISVADETIHLYSALGLHTLSRTSAPSLSSLPGFSVATMDRERLVGFFDGTLYEVMLGPAPSAPGVIGPISAVPELLSQHRGRVAYTAKNARGESAVWTLSHGDAQQIYATGARVSSLAVAEDRAYFIEQKPGSPWQLWSVPLDGGPAAPGPQHKGRAPAMLSAARQLFYYHGPERKVFRSPFDFSVELQAARDLVCSPLTVDAPSETEGGLFCAHLGGITTIDLMTEEARQLLIQPHGPITNLAVGPAGLVFVVDAGAEKLELSLLPR